MSEYIERDAAIKSLLNDSPEQVGYSREDAADCIRYMDASDVALVRHGRWLNFYGDFSTAECDICAEIYEVSPDESPRKEFFDAFKEFYKFCPNCGANMDLEELYNNGC